MKIGCSHGCGICGEGAPTYQEVVGVTTPVDLSVAAIIYGVERLRKAGEVAVRLEVHPELEFRAQMVLTEAGYGPWVPVVPNAALGYREGYGWMLYGAPIMLGADTDREGPHPRTRAVGDGITEVEVRCVKCGHWFYQFGEDRITIRPCLVCGGIGVPADTWEAHVLGGSREGNDASVLA